ncbi:ATP-binding protein [Candidatus Micrarchaeota archaeon]|nr:ATP-binding protein [Candidatus Micrarchaeota archaeon]
MEDFVQGFEKFLDEHYRQDIIDAFENYPDKRSLSVDFNLLDRSYPDLAQRLREKPDEMVAAAEKAIQSYRPVGVLDSRGVEDSPRPLHVRFFNLPATLETSVQNLGAKHLDRLFRVEGVVSWVTEIKPLMKTSLWQCIHCQTTIKTATDKSTIKPPAICQCGRRDFKLLEKPGSSEFINVQRAQIQELVEKLRGNAPTASVEVWLEDDLVNLMVPGEKFIISGVLRLKPVKEGKVKSAVYAKFIDAVHLQRMEREFEELEITKEEQEEIEGLAHDPALFEKIVKSVAPSIYGYSELKQAIALQLFGGTPGKVLPDGKKIRSDVHLLLIGDPGCLIADERVALGNGAIVKLGQMGEKHLQSIHAPILTGEGGKKRADATVFHSYPSQKIMEVVTESGKCVKGTYNHPLMVVNGMTRTWKRLDELAVGDRLATVTGIPCTIAANLPLDWKKTPRRFGPRNNVVLPTHLTSELAGWMGYVLGDGWVTRTRVAMDVNSEEEDLIPLLKQMALNQFGIPLGHRTERRPGKKPIHVLETHSVDVASNVQFLRQRRVPDLVLQSGNKVAAEFLAWLFEADGTVFSKGRGKRAVQLKSSEIELLRDVQILLLRFGIHSRIVERNLTIRRAQAIRKYAKSIGFRSAKKKGRLAQLVADVKDLHHEHGQQRSERIVSIRPAGVADVFDIEVPSAKRFIANGIISHNTAKSSILGYVSRISPKSVYVSGESATGVGLTASAERDKDGEGWILKAGAMVLANGGLAIIDEFDKMDVEDRGSIHQAMEQQVISVAKAGIVTQFQSKTSVLAAANPKMGRFDPNTPPAEQFNISPPLLSRFDLIFTIKDVLDETKDRRTADHILLGHKLSLQGDAAAVQKDIMPVIEMDLLRKYVAYARRHVRPNLTEEAAEKIKEFYVDLRKQGAKDNTFSITARHIEGIIRLSEASAKLRLSQRVELQDAERAIALAMFVLNDVFVDKTTGRIDSDIISIGQPKSKTDRQRTIYGIIGTLQKQYDLVAIDEIVKEAGVFGIDEVSARRIVDELKLKGDLYEPKVGHVKFARKESG